MSKSKNKNYRDSFLGLIDLIPDSVIVLDDGGTIVAANKLAGKYTGFKREELVGKHFSNFLAKKQISPSLAENIRKRLSGANIAPYEIEISSKNGSCRRLELSGKRFQHEGQLFDLIILHDVTGMRDQYLKLQETLVESEEKSAIALIGQKIAFESFKESEEKYRNLFENSPDVILTVDLTGKITSANQAVLKHGFKVNEIVGNSIFNFVPAEYAQRIVKRLKDIAVRKPAHDDIEILTPNGKRWAEYNSNPILQGGGVVGYQTIIRDVTERKKAEEKLARSEERLKLTLEAISDGVWDWDIPSGKTVFSPSYYTMLDYEPYEFTQSYAAWRTLVHPDDIDQAEKAINQSIAQNKGYAIELRMRTKAGGWWLDIKLW